MMRRLQVGTFLLLLPIAAHAQIKATTADGKAVLLLPNGTWKYATAAPQAAGSTVSVTRSPAATSKVDLVGGKASVYYDPAKWRVTKNTDPGRFSFQHSTGDGYAMIIAERIEIPLDTLRGIALANAQQAAPDARIVEERRLTVNGVEMLEMQIRGTIQGISFVYLGYYYASPIGSFQILTYTSSNLFDEYRADFQDFLNGFVIAQ